MNFWVIETKVFAFIFLFFAGIASISAQSDSSIYQLSAGTKLRVRMDNEINSKVGSINDTFTVTLAAPFVSQETVLLPIETVIEGRITKAARPAYGGKNGDLQVVFQTIRLANGQKREIEAVLVDELIPGSPKTSKALMVFGGTAIGGIIGAVSKVEKGALLGAGIGAGIGTGVALLRKGKDVSIKAGQEFEIKILKNVNLPVRDF